MNQPLDDIVAFLDRFVIFPTDAARDVVALWILHTWCFDAAYTTPYVYVSSPEKQSGKTRVLEVCAELTRNCPGIQSSVSAASLFNLIEAMRPTLLIDEVDAIFTAGYGTSAGNEDLRNILNSGYKHNGSVMRKVPAGPDDPTGGVRWFGTFAPKMLAGIDNGRMPDTIRDRSLIIPLKRKREGEEVERWMARKAEKETAPLREALQQWAANNLEALSIAEPNPIDGISDRAWDITEPLVAIAERNHGWTRRGREALHAILTDTTTVEDTLSPQAKVLLAARELFGNDKQRIPGAELAAAVELHPRRVAVLLKPYGIKPRLIWFGKHQARGYERMEFTDAWERYLPESVR